MKLKYLILLTVSVLVLGIDQATKVYVDRVMDLHSSITVVENFFNITYMRNKGAAFSFLSTFNYRVPFFILVSLVAVCVIISVLCKLRLTRNSPLSPSPSSFPGRSATLSTGSGSAK